MSRFKAVFKSQKIRAILLSIAFVFMVVGYLGIFYYGAFPKPEKPEPAYKINMYVTP